MRELHGRAKSGLENIVELGVLRSCSKCKKTKLLEDFSKNLRSPDGRRSWCKECFGKYSKKYNREYYDKNQERELERARVYLIENRELINSSARNRHKENPVLRLDASHRRRVSKINNSPISSYKISPEDWIVNLNKFNNKCFYCGTGNVKLTMDHVIPVSRGGLHSIENIVPACCSCNASKGDKMPDELTNKSLLVVARQAALSAKKGL